MSRKIKNLTAALAALTATVFLAACSPESKAADTKDPKDTASSAAGKAGETPSKPLSFPAADLTWKELPDSGGVKYANVKGDLAGRGPYEAFVKFPAGKDNPMHHHSQNLPTVVLKGTFYAEIDGKRTRYPAGSYYKLPAGKPHLSGCEKGEECLLFQYQSDNFDLVPTDAKK
ncbi:cupin domain-containing protein [Streptomyces sp. NPDC001667]